MSVGNALGSYPFWDRMLVGKKLVRLFERYKFLTSYQLIYLKIKLSYKLLPNLLKTIRKFHINEKPVYHKTKFFDKQLKLFCLNLGLAA